jgi:NADPH:quinone reductase-like Zn-dependent oxidoreductase
MLAIINEQIGEPADVLKLVELPKPEPAAGEVRIRVKLSPIHPSNLHVIRGRFGRQPSLPSSPGSECVGVVDACGTRVSGLEPGMRVILLNVWGTYQEFMLAPAERVIVVPNSVPDEWAAQCTVNPLTAYILTMIEHKLRQDEYLLQTAAGSTVGGMVLQIAKMYGFKTVNIVRRRDQVQEIRELGGNEVLCTDDNGWEDALGETSNRFRLVKAIDCVSGELAAAIARKLAPGGRLLVFGALSSHRQTAKSAFELPLHGPSLIYRSVSVQGWYLYHWFDSMHIQVIRDTAENVLQMLGSGCLSLPPAEKYPASDSRRQHLEPTRARCCLILARPLSSDEAARLLS